MDSGASGRGSNTEHAGGSLNRTVNPGRLCKALSPGFKASVRFCVGWHPLSLRLICIRWACIQWVLFRRLSKLLPALEGEHLFTASKTGKIEAAVFAPPFSGSQSHL